MVFDIKLQKIKFFSHQTSPVAVFLGPAIFCMNVPSREAPQSRSPFNKDDLGDVLTFNCECKRRSSQLGPFPVGVVGGCIVVT